MKHCVQTHHLTHAWIAAIIVLAIWSLIWKGLALWRAGRNKQLKWFVVMLIINTAGILEIVYLLWFAPKTKTAAAKATKKPVKK